MKTLAELRTEIELGMIVYPSTRPGVYACRDKESLYSIAFNPPQQPDRLGMAMGYPTLDDLIADDIAGIASQPVWSTAKPPVRAQEVS